MSQKIELLRSVSEDGKEELYLKLYPIIYDKKSRPFYCPVAKKRIQEVIQKGAFDDVLNNQNKEHVIINVNHNREKLLGRISSGTLKLSSDEYGVKALVKWGTTTLHNDVLEMIQRGDLTDCSFHATATQFNYSFEDGITVRRTTNVEDFKDISIVGYGQYKGANIEIVNLDEEKIQMIRSMDVNEKSDEVKDEVVDEKVEDKVDEVVDEKVEDEVVVDKVEEVEDEVIDEKVEDKVDEVIDEKVEEVEDEVKEENTDEKSEKKVDEKVNDTEVVMVRSHVDDKKNDEKNMSNYLNGFRSLIENPNGGRIEMVREGEITTTNSENVIPKAVTELSIKGYEPVWEKLGADFYDNADGIITLPFKSPAIGQKVAELAAITKDTVSPNANLLVPQRFGYTFEISQEALASAGDSYLQKLIVDGQKAAFRAFEESVYLKLIAGAGEVSTANALDYASIVELESEIDSDGEIKLVSDRKTFFGAMKDFIDAGSGKVLVSRKNNNEGETILGTPWLFSNNFKSEANTKYIVIGDMHNGLAIANYGKTEVIVNPYSLDTQGLVRITVNILMDSALKNPFVVKRTVDLDPTA